MFQRVAYLIGHANLFNTISFTCTSTKSSKLDSYRSLYLIKMVYEVGFEPTQPEGKGFTVLSGSPTPALIRKINVEPRGLEPLTFCLQSRCSSQLSYDPIMVDRPGLEPGIRDSKSPVLPLHQRSILI